MPKDAYKDRDLCRRCSGRLQVQKHFEGWKPKPRQAFYFQQWFKCNRCASIFMNEADKVFLTQQPKKLPAPKLSDFKSDIDSRKGVVMKMSNESADHAPKNAYDALMRSAR